MIDLRLYLVDGLVIVALVFLTAAVAGLWRLPGVFNRLPAPSPASARQRRCPPNTSRVSPSTSPAGAP